MKDEHSKKKPITLEEISQTSISIEDIKRLMQAKYGFISKFSRLIGMDTGDFHKQLKTRDPVKLEIFKSKILVLISKTENRPLEGEKIRESDRELFKERIYARYRTIRRFCKAYPQFSHTWLSTVFNGQFTTNSDKVKELQKVLKELEKTRNKY